jgi:segregation and condensation protein B
VDDSQLKAVVESLIFASEGPLSIERMKDVLGEENKKNLQLILRDLIEEYHQPQRGLTLVEVAGGYQFRTRPEYADWVRKLKKMRPLGFSQAAMETLAIIAYRQPLVRMEAEKIRGVDCGGVLRTLLERKLIKIIGKKDVPGKPLVYGTTKKFLETFGLKELSSLPTLKDIEGLGPIPEEAILPLAREGEPEDGENLEEESSLTEGVEANETTGESAKDPRHNGDHFPEEG